MAVSLNLLTGFSSTKSQATFEKNISRSSIPIIRKLTALSTTYGSKGVGKDKRRGLSLSHVANSSNQIDTDANENSFAIAEKTLSDDNHSTANQPPLNSSTENRSSQISLNNESSSQSSESSTVTSDQSPEKSPSPDSQSTRRSSLTARERLRAARMLNRYSESKTSKSDMGSKVLEALRESDRGKKKSRLPEAPTNLFDDSKRGLPKQGLTFQFPGGNDLFVIIFSFVFISTVMFATTYIVWKVGAIHFNEY